MVPNINPFSSHKNILVQLCPTLRDGYKNLSTKKDLDQVQVFLTKKLHCLFMPGCFPLFKNFSSHKKYPGSACLRCQSIPQMMGSPSPVYTQFVADGKAIKLLPFIRSIPPCQRTPPQKRGLFDFWIVRPLSIHFKVIWNLEISNKTRKIMVGLSRKLFLRSSSRREDFEVKEIAFPWKINSNSSFDEKGLLTAS